VTTAVAPIPLAPDLFLAGLDINFSEREFIDISSGEQQIEQIQIHDCGIVYYPKNPYILCIMTRGTDFAVQERAIQDLSKFIYNKVDDR